MRFLKGWMLVAAFALVNGNTARSTVVVDGFTAPLQTIQLGTGLSTNTVTGSDILGGTRTQTVFLDNAPPFAVGAASSKNGVFTGSFTGPNIPPGGSYFDLSYATAATNVYAGNGGFTFTASAQGGSNLAIIVNGTTTVNVTIPDAPGFAPYFVSFASFANASTLFSSLTSLEFKATFPNPTGSGPSITFSGPILITAVPEPSVLVLSAAGVLALGVVRLRRKTA